MKALLTTLAVLTIGLGVGVAPGLAQSTSGFVLNITAPDYSGCPALDDADVNSCDDVVIIGDSSNLQFVWIMTYGFNSTNIPEWGGDGPAGIAGARFGITYDDASVTVTGWGLCTGGSEIPMTDPIAWPAPNTGNAVTWSDACYDSPSADSFSKVGFFSVDAFSSGLMFIQTDPRPPAGIRVTDCETTAFDVSPLDGFSSASVDGPDADARKSCSMPVPTRETTWGKLKSSYSD